MQACKTYTDGEDAEQESLFFHFFKDVILSLPGVYPACMPQNTDLCTIKLEVLKSPCQMLAL